MAGQIFTRNNFKTVELAVASIINDMLSAGFTQVFPVAAGGTFTPPTQTGTFAPYSVSMDATVAVDPLVATQPWRLQFTIGSTQTVGLFIATPNQIDTAGNISGLTASATSSTVVDYAGATGAQWNAIYPNPADQTTGFFNRGSHISNNTAGSYPVSYCLSITPRGFALAIWEEATDNLAAQQSFVVVQRPVDRLTGAVLTTGKAPLFCVNGVGGQYWKFVVRESDINRPTQRIQGDANTPDSGAVINSLNQVAINEAGKYIINFPCRLNTQRYAYTQELDMLGYTSADVVSQFTDVPVTVYGESSARTYRALFANAVNDTGLRILFLAQGGGI